MESNWQDWAEEGVTSSGKFRHSVCAEEADDKHECIAEAYASTPEVAYYRARLIAAAPELLAALKVAHLWLDVDGRYDMQGINAALAKAEGRS
jgi:hypothetical protein